MLHTQVPKISCNFSSPGITLENVCSSSQVAFFLVGLRALRIFHTFYRRRSSQNCGSLARRPRCWRGHAASEKEKRRSYIGDRTRVVYKWMWTKVYGNVFCAIFFKKLCIDLSQALKKSKFHEKNESTTRWCFFISCKRPIMQLLQHVLMVQTSALPTVLHISCQKIKDWCTFNRP